MQTIRAARAGAVLLAAAISLLAPAASRAGARHPLIGDSPAVFIAAYGLPTLAARSSGGVSYGYGRCAGRSYPPILAGFVRDAAFYAAVYPCGGKAPDDWRARARAYLPGDATFSRTQGIGAARYWLYTSRSVAKAVPGAICGASGRLDGVVAVARTHLNSGPSRGTDAYLAMAMSCLQPTH